MTEKKQCTERGSWVQKGMMGSTAAMRASKGPNLIILSFKIFLKHVTFIQIALFASTWNNAQYNKQPSQCENVLFNLIY